MEPAPPAEELTVLHPAALFGIVGFVAILAYAVIRLAPLAIEPIEQGGLHLIHHVLYAVSALFMLYTEGYRGFYLRVAPRVVARAHALSSRRLKRYWLVAPIFCMSLVHANRRRLIINRLAYGLLVVVIVLVRLMPQPWRGILDAGVVVGLGVGALSIVYFFARALRVSPSPVLAELPDEKRNP